MLASSTIGRTTFGVWFKPIKGLCGLCASWQEVGIRAKARAFCFAFSLEACLSNQVVRISAAGAIAHDASQPADDLCYCRVSLFEGKDDGDGL